MARPKRLGPYEIQAPLGKGGMGHVYAAVHTETGRRVAVKALSPELAVAEGFRERFESEIETLRKLRHRGIVELYGHGKEGGTLFYAMELVDGASLDEEIRAGRRFTWREVTRVAVQVCQALKHAHDHGVVHRDIKPANILIDRDENVKLADFGIARLFGATSLTNAGDILGTADYMSPEQADGGPITDRCDQYSLGCVMYALLAGRPPFRGSSLPEMLQLQRYAEPEPVKRYAPHTPAALERTIGQLLAKSPDERFPNTLVLGRHLEAMTRALTSPARDDFHLSEGEGHDPPTPEAMAMTQPDPSAAGRELSPREQETFLATGSAAENDAREAEAGTRGAAPSETRYTPVAVDDPSGAPSGAWSAAAPLLVLLAMLGVLVAGGVWLLRPRDADTLYAAIEAVPEASWGSDGRARDDLAEFLRRFPEDPRAAELGPLMQLAAASTLERKLRNAALRFDASPSGFTAEQQLYISALRASRTDPTQGVLQFQRIAELLKLPREGADAGDEAAGGIPVLLTLVEKQIRRLEQRSDRRVADQIAFAESCLAAADRIAEGDPRRARRACEALIATYADKPWAVGVVERARRLVAGLNEAAAPEEPSGPP